MELINFMEKPIMERMKTSGRDSLLKICAEDQDVPEMADTISDQLKNKSGYMTVLIGLGEGLRTKVGVEV